MAIKNAIKAIPAAARDAATFTGAPQLLLSALPNNCSIFRIINGTNVAVGISYDGVTLHDVVTSGQALQISAQANAQPSAYFCNFPKGTPIYVVGNAGSMGTVWVAAYYQQESY